jgi:hypothetical protein
MATVLHGSSSHAAFALHCDPRFDDHELVRKFAVLHGTRAKFGLDFHGHAAVWTIGCATWNSRQDARPT